MYGSNEKQNLSIDLKPRLHDTTGCHTGCKTGCIV